MFLDKRSQTPVFFAVFCGFRGKQEIGKQKCDCNPVTGRKQVRVFNEAGKTHPEVKFGPPERRGKSPRVWAVAAEGDFPWVRLTRVGVKLLGPSWQLFWQLKLSYNSLLLMMS